MHAHRSAWTHVRTPVPRLSPYFVHATDQFALFLPRVESRGNAREHARRRENERERKRDSYFSPGLPTRSETACTSSPIKKPASRTLNSAEPPLNETLRDLRHTDNVGNLFLCPMISLKNIIAKRSYNLSFASINLTA